MDVYLYFRHADPVHPKEDRVDGPGSEDRVEHPLEVADHALGPVDGGHHLQDGEVTLYVLVYRVRPPGAWRPWSPPAAPPSPCPGGGRR